MADTVYEYTDAGGGVHRVSDLSQVPKDRLRFMVAIGVEEPAPGQASVGAAPSLTHHSLKPAIPPEAWAVSGAMMLFALFSKGRFLLRVFCGVTAVIYLLYSGWDGFITSDLARTAERTPKKKAPVVAQDE